MSSAPVSALSVRPASPALLPVGRGRGLTFTATYSRGNYMDFSWWKAREVAIGLFAGALIIFASWALRDPVHLSKVVGFDVTRIPLPALKAVLAVGVIALFRTAIWRPLVAHQILDKAFYPVRGYGTRTPFMRDGADVLPPDGQWRFAGEGLKIQTYDGREVFGTLLRGQEGQPHTGETVIFSLGNVAVYDREDPDLFRKTWLAQGYNVICYHPPGYGTTAGPRTPETDFLALEAVVQYAASLNGEESVSIFGQSLGSGAAVEIAQRYELKRLALLVPFGRLETVVQRLITSISPGLGYVARFFTGDIISDYHGYNNAAKIAHCKAKQITIDEGDGDLLMSSALAPTEGRTLFDSAQTRLTGLATLEISSSYEHERSVETNSGGRRWEKVLQQYESQTFTGTNAQGEAITIKIRTHRGANHDGISLHLAWQD